MTLRRLHDPGKAGATGSYDRRNAEWIAPGNGGQSPVRIRPRQVGLRATAVEYYFLPLRNVGSSDPPRIETPPRREFPSALGSDLLPPTPPGGSRAMKFMWFHLMPGVPVRLPVRTAHRLPRRHWPVCGAVTRPVSTAQTPNAIVPCPQAVENHLYARTAPPSQRPRRPVGRRTRRTCPHGRAAPSTAPRAGLEPRHPRSRGPTLGHRPTRDRHRETATIRNGSPPVW